jgi:moderate conductance mechanosensitive channel
MSEFLQRVFNQPPDWQRLLMAVIPALLLAWLVARLVRRLAARGLRAMLGDALTTASPAVRRPLRLIWAGVFVLVLGLVTVPILEIAGMHPVIGVRLRTLGEWAFGAGLRIVLITVLGYALVRTATLLIRRFEHEVNRGTGLGALERAKRAKTLGSVIRNVTTAVVTGIAILMILRELRMDITPVLTGAGIVGLAVGFGAQTLVRDIISGFFLILEDQVRVGDVAAINGQGGLVEAINLRTIVLRDGEGTVHVFPNGAINTLANRSKDFSYYVIDLGISYSEDPDRVMALLREIGAGLQADDKFGPMILEPIEIQGVDAFADWWVTLKLRIKTVAQKQWDVGRELRRRILKAFDEHGIVIPSPAPAMLRGGVVRPELTPANNPTDRMSSASARETPGRS